MKQYEKKTVKIGVQPPKHGYLRYKEIILSP